ncbi:MAG: hypothetical protein EOP05_17560, partial [Proteobacteria bacterium]
MSLTSNKSSSVLSYLESVSTSDLISDPASIGLTIRELLRRFGGASETTSLTLQDLELAFGKSIALGFSLWQHMAALDRLSAIPDWLANNAPRVANLRNGSAICGLATTHLSSPVTIHGSPSPNGYVVSGTARWVSGFNFFDNLILGFETSDAYCFALIPFPQPIIPIGSSPDSIRCDFRLLDLTALQSTSTGELTLENFPVLNTQLLSRREKNARPAPRKSSLKIPELGVAKSVSKKINSALAAKQTHPLSTDFASALAQINSRITQLEAERCDDSLDLAGPCHLLIQDTLRLFALLSGSRSLAAGSEASRLTLEAMLFDVFLQSENSMRLKIEAAAR